MRVFEGEGAWTASEDKTLIAYIKSHGEGKWRNLPKRAGIYLSYSVFTLYSIKTHILTGN